MRHRLKFNHLGRKAAHRKALLSHLTCDLIRHKRIITTLAKAKALRVYAEPLITKSKTNTTHQRRVVFSYLQDKEAVTELFGDISAKIGTRPGGYTRIIKLGARLGDAAEMAMIEFVDYNEIYSNEPADTVKKKRTRRGGSRGAKTSAPVDVQEVPKEEEKEAQETQETAKAEKTEVDNKEESTPAPKAENTEASEKKPEKPAADDKKDTKTKE